MLLFEDDVMVAPGVPKRLVTDLLGCGAALSLQRGLPLFYAGACGPKDMLNNTVCAP